MVPLIIIHLDIRHELITIIPKEGPKRSYQKDGRRILVANSADELQSSFSILSSDGLIHCPQAFE